MNARTPCIDADLATSLVALLGDDTDRHLAHAASCEDCARLIGDVHGVREALGEVAAKPGFTEGVMRALPPQPRASADGWAWSIVNAVLMFAATVFGLRVLGDASGPGVVLALSTAVALVATVLIERAARQPPARTQSAASPRSRAT